MARLTSINTFIRFVSVTERGGGNVQISMNKRSEVRSIWPYSRDDRSNVIISSPSVSKCMACSCSQWLLCRPRASIMESVFKMKMMASTTNAGRRTLQMLRCFLSLSTVNFFRYQLHSSPLTLDTSTRKEEKKHEESRTYVTKECDNVRSTTKTNRK